MKVRRKKLLVFIAIILVLYIVFSSLNGTTNSSVYNSSKNQSRFCVIATVFNPSLYKSRYDSFNKFEKHILKFDVYLITIELVFNNQTFQVTHSSRPNHIQLRTNDTLWYKENLINIAINTATDHCEYVAWIDVEVEFTNLKWVENARVALEKYKVIQLFEYVQRLGPNNTLLNTDPAFGLCNNEKTTGTALKKLKKKYKEHFKPKVAYCTTGFAWCSKRETLLKIGGLYDKAIVGEGDQLTAFSFAEWQQKAVEITNKSVGYIDGFIYHSWHGSSKSRNYTQRRHILNNLEYEPNKHLYYNEQGLLQFKLDVRDSFVSALNEYFQKRNEDSETILK